MSKVTVYRGPYPHRIESQWLGRTRELHVRTNAGGVYRLDWRGQGAAHLPSLGDDVEAMAPAWGVTFLYQSATRRAPGQEA